MKNLVIRTSSNQIVMETMYQMGAIPKSYSFKQLNINEIIIKTKAKKYHKTYVIICFLCTVSCTDTKKEGR